MKVLKNYRDASKIYQEIAENYFALNNLNSTNFVELSEDVSENLEYLFIELGKRVEEKEALAWYYRNVG